MYLQPKSSTDSTSGNVTVKIINTLLEPYQIKVLNFDSEKLTLNQLHIPRLVIQYQQHIMAIQELKIDLVDGFSMLLNTQLGMKNIDNISADQIYLNIDNPSQPPAPQSTTATLTINALFDAAMQLPSINIGQFYLRLPTVENAPTMTLAAKNVHHQFQGRFSAHLQLNQQPLIDFSGELNSGEQTAQLNINYDLSHLIGHITAVEHYLDAYSKQHLTVPITAKIKHIYSPLRTFSTFIHTHIPDAKLTGNFTTQLDYKAQSQHLMSQSSLSQLRLSSVTLTSDQHVFVTSSTKTLTDDNMALNSLNLKGITASPYQSEKHNSNNIILNAKTPIMLTTLSRFQPLIRPNKMKNTSAVKPEANLQLKLAPINISMKTQAFSALLQDALSPSLKDSIKLTTTLGPLFSEFFSRAQLQTSTLTFNQWAYGPNMTNKSPLTERLSDLFINNASVKFTDDNNQQVTVKVSDLHATSRQRSTNALAPTLHSRFDIDFSLHQLAQNSVIKGFINSLLGRKQQTNNEQLHLSQLERLDGGLFGSIAWNQPLQLPTKHIENQLVSDNSMLQKSAMHSEPLAPKLTPHVLKIALLDNSYISAEKVGLNNAAMSANVKSVDLGFGANWSHQLTLNPTTKHAAHAFTLPALKLSLNEINMQHISAEQQSRFYHIQQLSISHPQQHSAMLAGSIFSTDTELKWHLQQLSINNQLGNKLTPLIYIADIKLRQHIMTTNNVWHSTEQWQIDNIAPTSRHWVNIHRNPTVAGQWKLSAPIATTLNTLIPKPFFESDSVSGQYEVEANFAVTQHDNDSQLQLLLAQKIDSATINFAPFYFQGGQLNANCQFDWLSRNPLQSQHFKAVSQLQCLDTQFTVEHTHLGIDIDDFNLNADINLTKDSQTPATNWLQQLTGLSQSDVNIAASGKFLGGTFLIPDANIKLHDNSAGYIIVQGIKAESLLKQQPLTNVSLTGIFDGVLPAQLDQGKLSISGGKIAARQSGGILSIHPNAAIDETIRIHQQLETPMKALEKLSYQHLSGSFDMTQQGNAIWKLAIKGTADDISRPIHLQYQHQENLYHLYQSIQVPQMLEQQIDNHLQRNQ
ncbi:YdbH domain-containing protein [Shewanella intestini]|uniref:Dicarboxylate transport domain-containing protein n=1 Tax=Shewanella intestini TaxID=2017544 RepID=A0ABS5I1A1_9GAMM|nr:MULTISPECIES: YdbH domain-containing protein [Shewanella]MBR9727801.1 hypothetical protein [Shewanella intestini]